MSRVTWIAIAIVLAVIGLGAGLFLTTFERKLVDSYQPARGQARYNDLLALELALKRLRQPVSSITSLDPAKAPLDSGDTLVLAAGLTRIEGGEAQRLDDWVRDGGHLVLTVDGGEEASHTALFDRLKLLESKDGAFACDQIVTAPGVDGNFDLCARHFFPRKDSDIQASIGDSKHGYAFVRFAVGDGTVSVVDTFDPLENGALGRSPQQHFVRRLLDPGFGQGHFYLLYTYDGPSFWVRLLTQGWPALLASLMLLLAWAFMRGQRLGPLIPAPHVQRRALLEHVQAVGEFLFRRDAGYTLHALACRTVLARVRRMDPICESLEGDDLHARLGERYRLDPAHVARAFQSPANAIAFRDSLAILARLRNRP
ncbi:DUF4350 domain-containing protein [Dyella sp.]|uniref:DUF4350 domain-containing protein n=1 Tax=Dyella sp. TaxID=1869338 RepID=UPI002ED5FFE8